MKNCNSHNLLCSFRSPSSVLEMDKFVSDSTDQLILGKENNIGMDIVACISWHVSISENSN